MSHLVFSFLCVFLNVHPLILLFVDIYSFCSLYSSCLYCFIYLFLFFFCFKYHIFHFLYTKNCLLFLFDPCRVICTFLICSALPAVKWYTYQATTRLLQPHICNAGGSLIYRLKILPMNWFGSTHPPLLVFQATLLSTLPPLFLSLERFLAHFSFSYKHLKKNNL